MLLNKTKEDLQEAPVIEKLAQDLQENNGKGKRDVKFEKIWQDFTQKIDRAGKDYTRAPNPFDKRAEVTKNKQSLWADLFSAYELRGKSGLEDRIKYAFYAHVTGARFTASDVANQQTMSDLRYPTEWYAATRQYRRTIHLHVGPTNSGKTYQALKRLEQARTGCYAGPLRLLAHEVYTRLNAKGKSCALVTGEERRIPPGQDVNDATNYKLVSCTVEMLPLQRHMDVAVIDEIQMIGNAERGWAWTQALLGVRAREVHLCGEERTVPIIKELCASVGDKLEIHHYKRLSPLKVADYSLNGDLKKLRKGDCIVSFSVVGIHALRKQIEKTTGRKVATVYGSLPPETRAQQARLFNDPDNDYDYLVASDAVGMGLNLAIKRIVFESSTKFNGTINQTLAIADIKQIGGRAGRFRTAEQGHANAASEEELAVAKGDFKPEDAPERKDESVGIVTTLEKFDFPIVRAAMATEPEPIKTAGILPPAALLERFASYFPPGTPFSYIITRLHELCQLNSRFHLCGLKDQVWIADLIEPVQGLTAADRNVLCAVPARKGDNDMWKKLMPAYANAIATQNGGNLLDFQDLPLEILELHITPNREYLKTLEKLHHGVVAYLWLSYRFAGAFTTRALAFHVKELVEQKIEKTLGQLSFSQLHRKRLAQQREEAMRLMMIQEAEEKARAEAEANRSESEADVEEEGNEEKTDEGVDAETEDGENVVSLPTADERDLDDSEGEPDSPPPLPEQLHEQTSQLGGGDHFHGADEEIFAEPGLIADGPEDVREAESSDDSTPDEEASPSADDTNPDPAPAADEDADASPVSDAPSPSEHSKTQNSAS
jgi:ATP-dependent RNA helicase SUPV3L1/SUV3